MKKVLDINNINDVKEALEAGHGVYAARKSGAFFLRADGAMLDLDGQVVKQPNAEYAALYAAFDGPTGHGGGGGGGDAGGVYIVGLTFGDDGATLDKTAGEIISAINDGSIVVARWSDENAHGDWYFSSHVVMLNGEHAGEIAVIFYSPDNLQLVNLYAATEDDYPAGGA